MTPLSPIEPSAGKNNYPWPGATTKSDADASGERTLTKQKGKRKAK